MAIVELKKMTTLQSRGEAFVREVLNVTLLELAENGFERLSIPQIATLAGVNKTSIYRRWPTKAELVSDALKAAMQLADQAPDTGTLRGDLVELARTVANFIQSPVGKVIVRIMLAEGGNPDLRALAQTSYGQANSVGPWAVIKRAIERDEMSADADPSMLLFTLAGAIMHRLLVERAQVDQAYLERLINLVLAGAAARR